VSEHSPQEPSATERRVAALRRNAARRAERTVTRLQEGIAALTRASLPITGPLIKQETGLDYKTIQRNPAAYALFCKHAAHFAQGGAVKPANRPHGGSRGRKRARSAVPPQPTPRDPLLERPKRRLVDRIRTLETENAELLGATTGLALSQQEIEAQNMELRARLVATQRNLQVLIAEHTGGNA
jgi:hypothetical protein